MRMTQGRVTFSVVGLGGRASAYLSALQEYYPEEYRVVAVADPDPTKQARAKKEFDASLLKEYREINVIGWSMGVWAATQVMGKLQETDTALVIKNSIAINGTPYPIDDTYGIPTAIYHGTLEGLTGPSLHKFLRRMCFNGEAFKEFLNITPRRPLEELKEVASLSKAFPDQMAAVCHVLRHSPFFEKIRQIIESGRFGAVVSIQHNENIGYYHFAQS